jgi:hypothetical protein
MFNTIVGAGAVGAGVGAALRYGSGSGSGQKMRLLAAPAPQHWKLYIMQNIYKNLLYDFRRVSVAAPQYYRKNTVQRINNSRKLMWKC